MKSECVKDCIHTTAEGIYVDLFVSPGSEKNEISGYNMWRKCLEVKVRGRAVDGEANAGLIIYFARFLGIEEGRVYITKGQTSRKKKVFLEGMDEKNFLSALDKI
ncbi:MAG: DUF167 domain-containing protein [Thermoplasmata archaeon]